MILIIGKPIRGIRGDVIRATPKCIDNYKELCRVAQTSSHASYNAIIINSDTLSIMSDKIKKTYLKELKKLLEPDGVLLEINNEIK